MRNKNKINFLSLLNANLQENPFYVKLFETLDETIDKRIGQPLSQLSRVRSSTHTKRGDYVNTDQGFGRVAQVERKLVDGEPFDYVTIQLNNEVIVTDRRRVLQDRKALINGSVLLGFNYYSEFLTDEDYERVFNYISTYWTESGSFNFIKFIGYIKNFRLDMRKLWTLDLGDNATSDDPAFNYHSFLEAVKEDFTPIWDGGQHYPTSHVEVEYDAILSPNIDLYDLIRLFYLLAPIQLVLERIVGAIYAEIEVEGAVVPFMDTYETAVYDWKPQTVIDLTVAKPVIIMDNMQSGFLFLNSDFEEIEAEYI